MLNYKKIKTMKTLQVIDRIGNYIRLIGSAAFISTFIFIAAKLIFKF